MKKRAILPLALLVCATVILCDQAAGWKRDQAFQNPDITGVSSNIGKQRCLVSKEDAQNMTTRALVETVMTYPYLIDMYAFDYPDLWFGRAKELPMFRELLAREDGLALLKEEAEKEENDHFLQMHYRTLIGCVERALQK